MSQYQDHRSSRRCSVETSGGNFRIDSKSNENRVEPVLMAEVIFLEEGNRLFSVAYNLIYLFFLPNPTIQVSPCLTYLPQDNEDITDPGILYSSLVLVFSAEILMSWA